jgi:hypothetical protein
MKERAETFEKSLLTMNINTEGKLSLSEIYQMPFNIREHYIKLYNQYIDTKNKLSSEI